MNKRMTALLGVLALVGCAHQSSTPSGQMGTSSTTQPMTAQGGETGTTPDMNMVCPNKVAGTTVTAQDLSNSEALVFTTTGDVSELRCRAQRMAENHNRMHSGMGGAGMTPGGIPSTCPGMQGTGGAGGMMHGQGWGGSGMIDSDVVVEDIPNGVRLVFTPRDPARLDDLRTSIRDRAARLSSGECPMMR